MTENSGSEQGQSSKKGQFVKGQSGNPAGKPKGCLNHVTRQAQALLDGNAKAVTETCIVRAIGGDTTAMKLCMDRILPARKARAIVFDLPPIHDPQDVVKAIDALTVAVCSGQITPDEAEAVHSLLQGRIKAWESYEIADRITRLESLLEARR